MRLRCVSHDWRLAFTLFALLTYGVEARGQGIVLTGVGAVNRSMGGASVAAPIDASGAINWNPASIAGLGHSEMEIGMELLYPESTLSSSVQPGALGPGFPANTLSGSDRSGGGVYPLPTMSLVYRDPNSSWTYGLGMFLVGGLGVDYPASRTNPILTPQPPNGIGLGSIYSELQVLQLVPTVAYQLNDNWAVGFAPTLSLASLAADPLFVAAPDDSSGNGFPSFTSGSHNRFIWGGGFQTGVYYTSGEGWNLGASFKSPQWFEPFHFDSVDQLGQVRTLKFHANYPMIVSIGAGYTGFEGWTLAADLRYIDYKNTPGFDTTGFDATGAVRGLGWDSTILLALGAQYQLTESCSLRIGYSYSPNPIPDANSVFNVASPSIPEHTVYLGVSYSVSSALSFSLMYAHAFENSISGPIITPAGAIPGTSVTSQVSADTIALGAQVKF